MKHKLPLLKFLKSLCTYAGLVLGVLILFESCKKLDLPKREQVLDLKLVADQFVSPIGVVAAAGDKRLFVIDQIGKIWIINPGGQTAPQPFLDLTSKMIPLSPNYDERGLLGLAFHPDYKSNGRFFVYYQLPPRPGAPVGGTAWNNLSRIAEFRVSANPNLADMASEKVILEWDDPQGNHNGGTIAFGPDRYLYIAIGDGGGANDVGPGHVADWYGVNPGGNGQDIEANLFGDIIRIDVNTGSPYGIPADNPFVGKPGRDEIYAYGFRNPFRFSFDMGGTRQLYAGDAGQLLWEEISVVNKGGNYGWNVKEGTHCFNALAPLTTLPSCPTVDNLGNPLINPVIELNNWQNPAGGKATTIIGGNVYRGRIHEIVGYYFFGTFSQTPTTANGELFYTRPTGAGLWSYDEASLKSFPNDLGHYLKGFGQDNEGEIYLTMSSVLGPTGITGKVYKLVAVHAENGDD